MGVLKKLLLMTACVLTVIIASPSVSAEEDQTRFQEVFAGCLPEEVPEEERDVWDSTAKLASMPGCLGAAAFLDPKGAVKSAVNNVTDLSGFWDTAVGEFTQSVIEGNTEVMQTAMTFWMDYSAAGFGGSSVQENMEGVKSIVYYIAAAALVASFIVGGIKIAASRRVGLQDGIEDSAEVLGRWLLFSLAIPAMIPGALLASDKLAEAIMNEFGADAESLVSIAALDENIAGPIILLILALISIAGGIMQLIALVIRVLLTPIMGGLLPLFAASSFTETGKSGLQTLVNFIIAAVIFKPISAILYCVVLWNVSGDSTDRDLITAFVQVTMLAAAGFIAPALVFKILPMAAAAGGGNAAGLIGAGAGALGVAGGLAGGIAGGAGRALSSTGQKLSATTNPTPAQSGGTSTGSGASTGASTSRGGTSTASTPSGASGARSPQSPAGGATPRGAGGGTARRFAGAAARATGGVAQGAGAVARGIGRGASGLGQTAHQSQNLFSDALGTEGYAGQIRR